ncbi:hypothetical protein E4U14_002297 [Claviceps sp. LM454 group G7]|nr:hypothetical protein E4U14_002297 [Claviceps sp. LM454 group G7]
MARKHLTEAQRAEIRTLSFTAGLSNSQIADRTGYGIGQIRRAIRDAVPGVRTGRPPALSTEQQQELVEFVTGAKKNRSMSYLELSTVLFDGAHGESCIRATLRRLGFLRRGTGTLVRVNPGAKQKKHDTNTDAREGTQNETDEIDDQMEEEENQMEETGNQPNHTETQTDQSQNETNQIETQTNQTETQTQTRKTETQEQKTENDIAWYLRLISE